MRTPCDIVHIYNGTVLQGDQWLTHGDLLIENGRIARIGRRLPPHPREQRIAADACYVIPGFIEEHLHGCGGADFMDGTLEAFTTIVRTANAHGVTALAPTSVACSFADLRRFFTVYREAMTRPLPMTLLGIHMEGPYLSPAMRGAQSPEHLRPPDAREVDALLEFGSGILCRCSAAPELPGIRAMAEKLQRENIVLSVAHSNATCQQVLEAYQWGFHHITHLYCNTPSIRKIEQTVTAGVVEAAYLQDGLLVEIIGDGRHIPQEVLQLVLKYKGAAGITLTTDSMRAAGTSATESYLGRVARENRVIIEDRVAKLPDRSSFAGSIATSDAMLRVMVQDYGVPLQTAVQMMTQTPANHLRIQQRKGTLAEGKDADILLLDGHLQLQTVITGGRITVDRQGTADQAAGGGGADGQTAETQ